MVLNGRKNCVITFFISPVISLLLFYTFFWCFCSSKWFESSFHFYHFLVEKRNMSIETKLKEEYETIKELFNFNRDEIQFKHLKDNYTNLIRDTKNGSKYFIALLEYFSRWRPHQHNVSKELVKCVYSCFPKQIIDMKQYIKTTYLLKYLIFPEEFPIGESKEQQEMFLLLQKDNIEGFISFLSNNPTIDFTKEQKLEEEGYYSIL